MLISPRKYVGEQNTQNEDQFRSLPWGRESPPKWGVLSKLPVGSVLRLACSGVIKRFCGVSEEEDPS